MSGYRVALSTLGTLEEPLRAQVADTMLDALRCAVEILQRVEEQAGVLVEPVPHPALVLNLRLTARLDEPRAYLTIEKVT